MAERLQVRLRSTGVVMLAALTACGSEPMQAGAGLATATALLVVVPFIPFVKAYDALNDTNAKFVARFDHWNTTFGPIYAERAALVRQRDPQQDAAAAKAQGPIGYLPFEPDSAMFVDVQSPPADWRENNKKVSQNPVLASLQALLADDPKDRNPAESGYRYNAKAVQYAEFATARDRYRSALNRALEAQRDDVNA